MKDLCLSLIHIFVYADRVSELLGQPEPVCHGYSSTAQHRMLVILSLIHISSGQMG